MVGFSRAGFFVGTARARDVRAVSTCRFSTIVKQLAFQSKLRNLLLKSRLSLFFDAFFPKNVEGIFSPLNQDTKQIFEFEFAFHA